MRKIILATVFGVLGLAGFSAAASACEGGRASYTTAVPAYAYREPVRVERHGRAGRERFERNRFERSRFGR
ncbi:MAG TPA: hypothetical protein VFF06_36310 [Polyangia bacterium]|nr:hypothetical protein [Polyangia bacterium]